MLPLYGRETGYHPSVTAPEYHGKRDGVSEIGELVFEAYTDTK